MKIKKSGKVTSVISKNKNQNIIHPRPNWVPVSSMSEEELCPDCFKVVGERSRYNLVCMLGKAREGMTVGELTDKMKLQQPTVTHHLQVLKSVDAVESRSQGKRRIYKLNRNAHCFEDCKIPYQ